MDLSKKIATRVGYGETLAELGEDKKIVVLDADLSEATKTNIFAKKYPDRFFDMGISEQDMMSTAAGLDLFLQAHLLCLLQEEHMTKLEIVFAIQD